MITGNKGEWSEIYTLFKLLGDKQLFLGNKEIEKLEGIVYPILRILRTENNGNFEYSIQDEIILISGGEEVLKIEISEFALSFEIRLETTRTGYDEQVDEYQPTMIEDPDKRLFYLDYGVNFFFENNIKGKEITLMSYSEILLQRPHKELSNRIKETYIIADWTTDFGKVHDINHNEHV